MAPIDSMVAMAIVTPKAYEFRRAAPEAGGHALSRRSLVRLEEVTLWFEGNCVLNRLHLNVAPMQRLVVMGPSGGMRKRIAVARDCRGSPEFRRLSELSRKMNKELLSPEQVDFLRELPRSKDMEIDGRRFHLSHATPGGDLYRYDLTPEVSDET